MESLYRIKLFRGRESGVSLYLDAFINKEDGKLVIEGQNVGPGVSELYGDSDYEYWLSIPAECKKNLLERLIELDQEVDQSELNQDQLLLSLINKYFNTADGVSRLKEFCSKHSIPSEFFSYH